MKKSLTRTRNLVRKASLMAGPAVFMATSAFAGAANSSGSGGMSTLMLAFLAFVGVIVLMQLIPAVVIFGSLITAVFKRSKKATETTALNERV